jgi:hypothetical protein
VRQLEVEPQNVRGVKRRDQNRHIERELQRRDHYVEATAIRGN